MTRDEILERLCLLHYKVTFNLDFGKPVCFCNNNPQEDQFGEREIEFIEKAVEERLQIEFNRRIFGIPEEEEKV